MKKTLSILTMILALSLSSCAKKPQEAEDIKIPTPPPEPEVSEFYKEIAEDNTRPLALMIDNDDKSARPQIGLEDAYIVYEIIVEGGSTRFMALFKDKAPEKAGPVRSSRHYFLDYAMENDAIYSHVGWSPKASQDIKSLGINNINGITGKDGVNFWRDNTYNSTWHNLYTSIPKLRAHSENVKGYRGESDTLLLNYHKNDEEVSGTPVTSVLMKYSPHYRVEFRYNTEKKVFERYINSEPHKSQTGEIISCKNIIVYQVKNYNLPDTEDKGRQDIKNIGSGTGYYLSNGKIADINWSKDSRKSQTRYTLPTGEELMVNPGNTFIQIVPTAYDITYQ